MVVTLSAHAKRNKDGERWTGCSCSLHSSPSQTSQHTYDTCAHTYNSTHSVGWPVAVVPVLPCPQRGPVIMSRPPRPPQRTAGSLSWYAAASVIG
ncbi:hypothetical protein PAMP_021066 [Pampus punctatissimus]